MDIIFNLLKQLASALSPTEFLLVLGVIAITSFTIVKFVLSHVKKSNDGLMSLFSGGAEEDQTHNIILTKLELALTAQVTATDRIIKAVEDLRNDSEKNTEAIKLQITDFLLLKKDLEKLNENVTKELDEFNHTFKMHDLHDQQVNESIRDHISRLQESISKLSTQVERVDDFSRNAVPEFRSYHKELSKEINDLSRDIALVERSIQTQINTVNAVKLR